MLEEIQANAVERLDDASQEIAVSINGSFSWKFGEKEKDQPEFDDPVYGGRRGRRGGVLRGGVQRGRRIMRRTWSMFGVWERQ